MWKMTSVARCQAYPHGLYRFDEKQIIPNHLLNQKLNIVIVIIILFYLKVG